VLLEKPYNKDKIVTFLNIKASIDYIGVPSDTESLGDAFNNIRNGLKSN